MGTISQMWEHYGHKIRFQGRFRSFWSDQSLENTMVNNSGLKWYGRYHRFDPDQAVSKQIVGGNVTASSNFARRKTVGTISTNGFGHALRELASC